MAFLDTPPSSFDPYSQDRMAKMDLFKQQSANFNAGQQAPLGFLDPEMQRYLESKTREDVRSANPKAGGSGWLQDREATELLKLRMALLDKNLQESNNQRQNLTALAGIQQPMQHVQGDPGILTTAGTDLMGSAVGGMGAGLGQSMSDWLRSAFGGGKAPQNPNPAGQSTFGQGMYSNYVRGEYDN